MSAEKTLCPVCGSQVIHHYDNEGGYEGDGTHSYEPDTAENQRLREERDMQKERADALGSALDGQLDRGEKDDAENQRLREIAEAAEALIERTITDLTEVGRREVRLSALLRQWRIREALAGDAE